MWGYVATYPYSKKYLPTFRAGPGLKAKSTGCPEEFTNHNKAPGLVAVAGCRPASSELNGSGDG